MLSCKRNICFILQIYVLLLSHFLVINTANISKVVSMLFSQRWSNADEQTQLSFSTKYKSWNSTDLSTLNQRSSFTVASTLFYQRWNNVDKHKSAQLSFSTKILRLKQHCFIDVESMQFYQRCFNVVKTTLMNVDDRWLGTVWKINVYLPHKISRIYLRSLSFYIITLFLIST